jgi:hypothetical protein
MQRRRMIMHVASDNPEQHPDVCYPEWRMA